MTTKVQKWGNSIAVRVPREVARKLNFVEGQEVVWRAVGENAVLAPVRKSKKHITTADWENYALPETKQEKEDVVTQIDQIVYGASR